MNVPITQSKLWQKLVDDLGEKSYFSDSTSYQYLAILKSTKVGNYLYLPYGPVVKSQSDFKLVFSQLKAIASKHNSIFIRVEPQLNTINLSAYHAVKSQDLNPKETWILDLRSEGQEFKEKLPSRLLRYYKNYAKNGITIETSKNPEDIHYLLDLQRKLAKEKGISTFSENYLRTELSQPFATLYLVKHHDEEQKTEEIIAAGLVFDDEKVRYNLQGAQSDLGRKLHATGILTIKLILDAREKGLEFFDFWGIAPENAPASHPWKGFTDFKKTFKGYEKTYLGTYDLVLRPFKYRFYQFFRKINRLVRHS